MDVVTYPSPILSRPCDDVIVFGPELQLLLDSMAEVMYSSDGIGLAANQIGLSQRFILVDPSAGEVGSELVALANPRITWLSDEIDVMKEGCLSLPGVTLSIPRSIACDVEYFDLSGEMKTMRCVDLKARIVQHEIDHLLGIKMLKRTLQL